MRLVNAREFDDEENAMVLPNATQRVPAISDEGSEETPWDKATAFNSGVFDYTSLSSGSGQL